MLSSDFAAGMVCAARWDRTGSAYPSSCIDGRNDDARDRRSIGRNRMNHAPRAGHARIPRAVTTIALAFVGASFTLHSGARPEVAGAQHHADRSVRGRRRLRCLLAHHGRGDVQASGPERHHRERRRRRRRDRVAARQECRARRLHDRLRPHGHPRRVRRDQPEAALRPPDRLRLSRHPPRDAAISCSCARTCRPRRCRSSSPTPGPRART